MCEIINMVENISLVLTAFATFFAAVAAWCSYSVSKNSLKFQKNYALNQNLLNDLNCTIKEAFAIRLIMSSDPDESNDEITSLITNLKAKLLQLNEAGIIDFQTLKFSSVKNVYELTKEPASLTETINELKKKHSEVFK
jgi:hypothetical protein